MAIIDDGHSIRAVCGTCSGAPGACACVVAALRTRLDAETEARQAAERERDEAKAACAAPMLARDQPCGCVICYCDGDRCRGCGAHACEKHAKVHALLDDPSAAWAPHPLLARAASAEKALADMDAAALADSHRIGELSSALDEARRALEPFRRPVFPQMRDTDEATITVTARDIRNVNLVLSADLARGDGVSSPPAPGEARECGTCGGSGAVPVAVMRTEIDAEGDPVGVQGVEPAPCPACAGGAGARK